MLNPRSWMIGAIALWAVALLIAVVGFVVDGEVLIAFSFFLRRVAFLATIIWLIFAAVATGWRFVRRR